jgi:hypothetical protein
MPIYLPASQRDPRGPDGKGWNRMSFYPVGGDECALRPTDAATLMESWNTVRARYGSFGACVTEGGDCDSCPIFARLTDAANRPTMKAFGDRVLFRIHPERGFPVAMNRPEDGFGSSGYTWSWGDLAMLTGWDWDGFHRDEYGEGFWVKRAPAT